MTPVTPGLRLRFAAISDVGRVRKDNQDSGYAGPWLLTVCDGVGGAARGDIASSTAVQQLRNLDQPPEPEHTAEELIAQVAGALHRAHDRIAELVDEDPALSGTSTTATVARFDGAQIALGHVGDSRAYLHRDGELTQLTHDHTFVQTLIDEGRLTEEESRYHPHRNLILKALDGQREAEPDLFVVPLEAGDRLLLCSDGVSGVLDPERIADVLGTGSPDFAAVELVRASLEAGSSDNVTCVVAEVVPADPSAAPGQDAADATLDGEPQLVGAAAELRRRLPRGTSLFRGHRSGDTGELEPVDADVADLPPGAIATDPLDPEAARYAPRAPRRHPWLRRLLVVAVVVGLLWAAGAVGWSWTQRQFFVGEHDGKVTIFRGINTSLAGFDLSTPFETTDLDVDGLEPYDVRQLESGVSQHDLAAAHRYVEELAGRLTTPATTPATTPTPAPTPAPAPNPTGT